MRARSIRIVGAREIRSMLGDISRQRAWQLTNREDFPEPMAQLTEGRFWFVEDVEDWRDKHRGGVDYLTEGRVRTAMAGSVDQSVRAR
jgi:prophage regulatory protein